jgi:hypothetical protein
MKYTKGQLSLKNGIAYEQKIHEIIRKTVYNGKQFNTQTMEELGKSSHKTDLLCENDIGIEVKSNINSPDWVQSSIYYSENQWKVTKRTKLLPNSVNILNESLYDKQIFETIPNLSNMTYEEWKKIKKNWKDVFIPINNNTIQTLYREKNCDYIQIQHYGLYHLGEDPCNFNVPYFETSEQRLRVRIKVHSSNKNNKCVLSVTAACQPVKPKTIPKSNYSLDNIEKLPSNLIFYNYNF